MVTSMMRPLGALLLLSLPFHPCVADDSAPIKNASVRPVLQQLSPNEQLEAAGSGIYFLHDFDVLGLMHPASHAWWEKTSTLMSNSLKLTLIRGNEYLQLTVHDYKGPGTYNKGDYMATLVRKGHTYVSSNQNGQALIIEHDEKGWISGQFNALLVDEDNAQTLPHRISHGTFRLSREKSPVVAIFNDL